MPQIDLIKSSEFEIFLSVERYDKKNRNGYDAKERIVSKLSRILIPNFESKLHVPIFNTFRKINRQRSSWSSSLRSASLAMRVTFQYIKNEGRTIRPRTIRQFSYNLT